MEECNNPFIGKENKMVFLLINFFVKVTDLNCYW